MCIYFVTKKVTVYSRAFIVYFIAFSNLVYLSYTVENKRVDLNIQLKDGS